QENKKKRGEKQVNKTHKRKYIESNEFKGHRRYFTTPPKQPAFKVFHCLTIVPRLYNSSYHNKLMKYARQIAMLLTGTECYGTLLRLLPSWQMNTFDDEEMKYWAWKQE
uniref:Uncharacterized protein n=1 Tax=Onchocerca volvulus TaxID=6282 RepID=A0A8R1TVN7_ONCVO